MLTHCYHGNQDCATPKPFTAPKPYWARHYLAFLPSCACGSLCPTCGKGCSVAGGNGSREQLWFQNTPHKPRRATVPGPRWPVGTGRGEASTRRVRSFCQNRAAPFSEGGKLKQILSRASKYPLFSRPGAKMQHIF